MINKILVIKLGSILSGNKNRIMHLFKLLIDYFIIYNNFYFFIINGEGIFTD